MKPLCVFGTRPEAIKLAPVIRQLETVIGSKPIICVTGQHRKLLDQAMEVFHLRPDYDLDSMVSNQSLFHITSSILRKIEPVLTTEMPDLVIVQGDAHSALVGALAAYYLQIPVAHVEAGLRTKDKYSPFPEEINRQLIDRIADILFAPTTLASENLLTEGIEEENIFVIGNTEIDALKFVLENIPPKRKYAFEKRVILVTAHRRESLSDGISSICSALKTLTEQTDNIAIVYPVHPNPNVGSVVRNAFGNVSNITLLQPPDYATFCHLMSSSTVILTDSGGIQEDAAFLGIPTLVLRDKTERIEGIQAGAAKLVGTNSEDIISETKELLLNETLYEQMASAYNPYGDGTAAEKICEILKARYP